MARAFYRPYALSLNKADLNSLDFVINRFFDETLQNFKLGHSAILPGTVLF